MIKRINKAIVILIILNIISQPLYSYNLSIGNNDLKPLGNGKYQCTERFLNTVKTDILNCESDKLDLNYQINILNSRLKYKNSLLNLYSLRITETDNYYKNRLLSLQKQNSQLKQDLNKAKRWKTLTFVGGFLTAVIMYIIVNNSIYITIK